MLLEVHGWGRKTGNSVNVYLFIYLLLDFGSYVMIFFLGFRSRIWKLNWHPKKLC